MMDGGGWAWMWLWGAAFWIAIIAAGVWLVVRLSAGNSGDPGRSELDRRLAAGDIEVAEYESRRAAVRRPSRRWSGAAVAVVALAALGTLVAAPAVLAARGDWDMGGWDMFDQMRGMMGGGSDTSGSALTVAGANATVSIKDLAFTPGNLRVPVGATVTWTNSDGAPHNATASNGDWKTSNLSKGESASRTFDRAGEYDYVCTIHPSMKAHLSVR